MWKNKDYEKLYKKNYYLKNKKKILLRAKDYYKKNSEKIKNRCNNYYHNKYYKEGFCEICGNFAKGNNYHQDHNHKTNQLRGKLCRNCNIRLGWYERNLKSIIKYLTHWDGSVTEIKEKE